jgi:hypothetical protein
LQRHYPHSEPWCTKTGKFEKSKILHVLLFSRDL